MCHLRVLGLLCVSKVELIWRMKGHFGGVMKGNSVGIPKLPMYGLILRDFHYEVLNVFWMFLWMLRYYFWLFSQWCINIINEQWANWLNIEQGSGGFKHVFIFNLTCRNDPNGLKPSTSIFYIHIFFKFINPSKDLLMLGPVLWFYEQFQTQDCTTCVWNLTQWSGSGWNYFNTVGWMSRCYINPCVCRV